MKRRHSSEPLEAAATAVVVRRRRGFTIQLLESTEKRVRSKGFFG
jgi:hypothetical protein